MSLADDLLSCLRRLVILPRLLALDTPGVRATVPMLRGVWGAALHDLDPDAYRAVFSPPSPNTPVGYLLRPAPPDTQPAPAVHWSLFGAACAHDEVLRRAWDVASGMGLGPQRRRWFVRRWLPLGPDGRTRTDARPWSLAEAAWPLPAQETSPCRLEFAAPLRLLRDGRLIDRPTIADLAVAAMRRVGGLLPEADRPAWDALRPAVLDHARNRQAGPWRGGRLDLVRWSSRQQAEVDLHGVSGSLELPEGPGHLWPLLTAAAWLHLGKGTAVGLGEVRVLAAAEGGGMMDSNGGRSGEG